MQVSDSPSKQGWPHDLCTSVLFLLQPLDSRIYILYTLYNLPEVYILAALVDFFDSHKGYVRYMVMVGS